MIPFVLAMPCSLESLLLLCSSEDLEVRKSWVWVNIEKVLGLHKVLTNGAQQTWAHCIHDLQTGRRQHLDSASVDPRHTSFQAARGCLCERVSPFLAHDPEIVSTS
jgi:hypothetical protein